jgi:hypothetical protein
VEVNIEVNVRIYSPGPSKTVTPKKMRGPFKPSFGLSGLRTPILPSCH